MIHFCPIPVLVALGLCVLIIPDYQLIDLQFPRLPPPAKMTVSFMEFRRCRDGESAWKTRMPPYWTCIPST
jgi:hypothetical protein